MASMPPGAARIRTACVTPAVPEIAAKVQAGRQFPTGEVGRPHRAPYWSGFVVMWQSDWTIVPTVVDRQMTQMRPIIRVVVTSPMSGDACPAMRVKW